MNMMIQAQGFKLTEGLTEHAKRRLRFALSRSSEQIQRVKVRLTDINGPRGGVDKRCRIEIQIPSQPALMIEQLDSDMYVAISRSAARAERRVIGHLKRKQFTRSPRNTYGFEPQEATVTN